MSSPIISVENLGKCYRISHRRERQGYVALRDVIAEKAKGFFQKLKPSISVSGTASGDTPISASQRLSVSAFQPASVSSSEDFWALRNLSFEVKQGEVLGVIGRNGAGKSTLLKILSRITEPSEGRVRIKGRVASLLEVGTGFHPELTGRENVFLNGAILGMSRIEIKTKFDEIVAFAEVDKFLDTPVKRYSSGMYVRLAFAVAAHLEPEILVVDEVLAVGDAQFQKKCLGKIGDVAKGGRTVLFVSHNMTAVKSLCRRALLIRNGNIACDASTEEVVQAYFSSDFSGLLERRWENGSQAPNGGGFKIQEARLVRIVENASARLTVETAFDLVFRLWSEKPTEVNLSLHFMTPAGEICFAVASPLTKTEIGATLFTCHVPPNLLNDGTYSIELLVIADSKGQVVVKDILTFEIDDCSRSGSWLGKWPGFVRPQLKWDFEYSANNEGI